MTRPAAARRPDPREVLALGLAEAQRQPGMWLVHLPAPRLSTGELPPVSALLRSHLAAERAVVWERRDGRVASSGAGIAVELTASGPDRFAQIRRDAEPLWQRVAGATILAPHALARPAHGGGEILRATPDQLAALAAPTPRLFGGFAFAAGAAGGPWSSFGDAWFAWPRWTYHRDGDLGWLSLAVSADEAALPRWFDELDEIGHVLATPAVPGDAARVLRVTEPDQASWNQRISDICASIERGAHAKIVAATATVFDLANPIDAASIVDRLGERHGDCTRFALRRGPATFVGATPEHLVSRRGLELHTESLAGSLPRSRDPGEDPATQAARLVGSAKERDEHDLVTRAIIGVLTPLAAALDVPAEVSVRTLRHVLHLHTPIRGRLAAPTHVLELVAAMHPTPAVGGTPTQDALRWIARHEGPRGWYAAPVGWFDASGDGDFAVAIRSGLFEGSRATVWAGAGIVAGSSAEAELAEVRLKQRAVLGALGVL